MEGLLNSSEVENFFVGQPDGEAVKRFQKIVKTFSLNMKGGVDIKAAYSLKKWTLENKIDIVDAHSGNAHSIALISKILGAKFKLVVHRRVDNVPRNNFINSLKYKSNHISKFVCISDAICRVMKSIDVDPSKLEVVKSAVDSAPYVSNDIKSLDERLQKTISKYQIDKSKVVFLCAAAFTEQKGHATLLKAWENLSSEHRESAVLLLAGEGVLKKQSEKFVSENSLGESIKFLGWCDDVPDLLLTSDVFVMPSNWEGLGTILLEASFASLPLCASNVGGIPEIIENDSNGYLNEVGDFHQLAKNMTLLISSKDRREKFGEFAFNKAKDNFSLESMIDGNLKIYKSLLR
jgi:glycosyltransferase involved in cell wall biosynthesis